MGGGSSKEFQTTYHYAERTTGISEAEVRRREEELKRIFGML